MKLMRTIAGVLACAASLQLHAGWDWIPARYHKTFNKMLKKGVLIKGAEANPLCVAIDVADKYVQKNYYECQMTQACYAQHRIAVMMPLLLRCTQKVLGTVRDFKIVEIGGDLQFLELINCVEIVPKDSMSIVRNDSADSGSPGMISPRDGEPVVDADIPSHNSQTPKWFFEGDASRQVDWPLRGDFVCQSRNILYAGNEIISHKLKIDSNVRDAGYTIYVKVAFVDASGKLTGETEQLLVNSRQGNACFAEGNLEE